MALKKDTGASVFDPRPLCSLTEIGQRLQQLRHRVPQREAAAVLRRPGAHQQRGPDHVQELFDG